jgi:hypothetical protein
VNLDEQILGKQFKASNPKEAEEVLALMKLTQEEVCL